jgi:SDR family mycofactocin-dependent oxidoreductase
MTGGVCVMGRVDGKVAFITGAARGMGRSHALRLAEEGADIIAIDACADARICAYPMATEADLAKTVAQVEALDRRIISSIVDVRDLEGLRKAVEAGVAALGRLDIVVANAGIDTLQSWDEITPEVWQDTIDVNLTGVWNTCAAAIPSLIATGRGSIVITSSTAGIKGLPFNTPYVAAKFGVVGVAKSLANELGQHRIRVNTVHPTGTDTDMVKGLGGIAGIQEAGAHLVGLFENSLPVELMDPADVSNAVLWLASDESRYTTGLCLTVDAGNTIR